MSRVSPRAPATMWRAIRQARVALPTPRGPVIIQPWCGRPDARLARNRGLRGRLAVERDRLARMRRAVEPVGFDLAHPRRPLPIARRDLAATRDERPGVGATRRRRTASCAASRERRDARRDHVRVAVGPHHPASLGKLGRGSRYPSRNRVWNSPPSRSNRSSAPPRAALPCAATRDRRRGSASGRARARSSSHAAGRRSRAGRPGRRPGRPASKST